MEVVTLLLHQLGLLLIVVVLFAFLVKLLKQPIIIGYVLAGLTFSYFLTDSKLSELMVLFGELGIMFLLFLMGIEFDLKTVKAMGKEIFIATFIQSIIFFIVGFGVGSLFGFDLMLSIHAGILFMFSSTLLVAKWLEDKKETNTLHGKIIITTLIIQDIFAITAITILRMMNESSLESMLFFPFAGLILILSAFIFGKYVLKFPFRFAQRYPELLLIMGLSICFIFVELANLLKYSPTIGAFIGGIVLGNTVYKNDLYTRLSSLVIFFNMLFFVGLGFQIHPYFEWSVLSFLLVMIVLSLTLKPFIIYLTLRLRGYDYKTSILSGIYLGQVSEFAIIIIVGSIGLGLVSAGFNSIVISLVILTMIFSSYLIKYSQKLTAILLPIFEPIDRQFFNKDYDFKDIKIDADIVFFGYYEEGDELIEKINLPSKKIFVIENDPDKIKILEEQKIKYVYTSIYLESFFEHLHFKAPQIVISNRIDLDENKDIVRYMRKVNPKVLIILQSRTTSEALKLYDEGADYVICPSDVHEQQISVFIDDYITDINKVVEKKLSNIERLKKRNIKKIQDIKNNTNTNLTKKKIKDGFNEIENLIKELPKKVRKK